MLVLEVELAGPGIQSLAEDLTQSMTVNLSYLYTWLNSQPALMILGGGGLQDDF